METSTDTDSDSVYMSLEETSPCSPQSSTFFDATDENPSDSSLCGPSDVDNHLGNTRDISLSSEHDTSLHGSFGIAKYVNRFRSSSTSQDQHALGLRTHSPGGSYDSLCTTQISHPQILRENYSPSDSVENDTASVLSFQSTCLKMRALSPDLGTYKRPRDSSHSAVMSDNIESFSGTRGSEDIKSISSIRPTPTLIVPDEYVQDFLDDLSDHIHKTVLENLCPDNMRGSFCRTPEMCLKEQCFFACPSFAITRNCRAGGSASFTHYGHKHTLHGCHVVDKVDCQRKHADGYPCRVKVIYFHVRAACITLRGGRYCQKEPCEWGHNHKDIRQRVMTIRKHNSSETETDTQS